MIHFIWDVQKEFLNIVKHGVDFDSAQLAFADPDRLIYFDSTHSEIEKRFFCYGKVGHRVLTVRFTYRSNEIRIIGAGYWRKGAKIYEEEKKS